MSGLGHGFNNVGSILVLFILLVIIVCGCGFVGGWGGGCGPQVGGVGTGKGYY
ncbi:hypothetical protein SAMN05216378_1615 [Paenibacillus catalpae]|uniref:Sporulation protein YjcZ n=1 Tax=Paenibacillus catalpae TaxID=1045775 RepID=A0A1I1VIX9_9BACL|nr:MULTISPECIES: hypothetical protein [Paenibacillus]MCM3628584.1 hypothetical protein [Paenibacillus glycanilyticus]SFD82809.1 hypothetical protein SAMN05216378_1615 [Paenibacillus catalpae]